MKIETLVPRPPPMWTVEQATRGLKGAPALGRGTLSKLGRECTLLAKLWGRPTGQVEVTGQNWTHVKSYTADVLKEVFRLNPATSPYMPTEEPQS